MLVVLHYREVAFSRLYTTMSGISNLLFMPLYHSYKNTNTQFLSIRENSRIAFVIPPMPRLKRGSPGAAFVTPVPRPLSACATNIQSPPYSYRDPNPTKKVDIFFGHPVTSSPPGTVFVAILLLSQHPVSNPLLDRILPVRRFLVPRSYRA